MIATLETHTRLNGPVSPTQHVVLHNVRWADYEMIGLALRDRPNLRLTYDRGALEIMTLSPEHERLKAYFFTFVELLCLELNIGMVPFGSTTYRQQEGERGIEPDQCFYFTNLERVRNLDRVDLTRDPVPDFAIEIDITSSSLNRLEIYARLGIQEVWRWEQAGMLVYTLGTDGQYVQQDTSSLLIPNFDPRELLPFVEIARRENHTAMMRAFMTWVRQIVADRGLTP